MPLKERDADYNELVKFTESAETNNICRKIYWQKHRWQGMGSRGSVLGALPDL